MGTKMRFEDRQTIERLLRAGATIEEVAKILNKHRDTIYKELKRAGVSIENKWQYTAEAGQKAI